MSVVDQKECHHARCAFCRLAEEAVASLPNSADAVVDAVPPAQWGAPTSTRNVPSAFGLKLTETLVELTREAVIAVPPAVNARRVPKVDPVPPAALSTQVSASVPVVPETA